MKPLRKRLDTLSRTEGLRLDTIQQDYILTWLLGEIGRTNLLHKNLVFKGGTALKKCYFGQYRFSEDLDFTALESAPTGSDLDTILQALCVKIESKIAEHAPMQLICQRYIERQPHPHGQEAFVVRAQFPWQREPLTKVMIEVSREEKLLFPSVQKKIIHEYDELAGTSIRVYSLEEVVLEKLRAILQHTRKLHERDWSRSRARDYYDLWHILCGDPQKLKLNKTTQRLREKCSGKDVTFADSSDFFQPVMVANVKQTWSQWLGQLTRTLPPVDRVLGQLRPAVESLLER